MAMAQAGIGVTRVVMLIGAGMAGSVVLRNGRLSEILTEMQVRLASTTSDLLFPPDNPDPDPWERGFASV
jgi:hypothetical protein